MPSVQNGEDKKDGFKKDFWGCTQLWLQGHRRETDTVFTMHGGANWGEFIMPLHLANMCEQSVNLLVLSRSSCLLLTSLLLCLPLYIFPPPPHCVLAKTPVV
uniref:Uncharacterized protein n=1 Tax=Micrurus spixii TaxID=129469 RepID=A0A2D4N9T0_9SAUR